MTNSLIDKVSSVGGLEIEIWTEDLQHAIDGHPEVTIDKVKETLKDPSKVIQSKNSKNACLFYSVEVKVSKTEILFFCVVVAVTGSNKGKLVTAYDTDFIKTGNILFTKQQEAKMNLKYLADNDLMYIYFQSNVPNTQTRTSHDGVFKFVAKADKSKIIGYEVEEASKNLNYVLTKLGFNSKQKLGVCLHFLRERAGKTQEQFADVLNISLSKYKSLEKADHNINFDTLESIFETFPNEPILETVFHMAGQIENNES